jgi:hypothetical protein
MRAAAVEVTGTKSDPPIADAFYAATVSVPRNSWLSALAVACQYQADHPADDGEPVTGEWLRSLGIFSGCFGDRCCGWHNAKKCHTLNLKTDRGNVSGIDVFTRGDVRRLTAALGVPLRAGEGE